MTARSRTLKLWIRRYALHDAGGVSPVVDAVVYPGSLVVAAGIQSAATRAVSVLVRAAPQSGSLLLLTAAEGRPQTAMPGMSPAAVVAGV